MLSFLHGIMRLSSDIFVVAETWLTPELARLCSRCVSSVRNTLKPSPSGLQQIDSHTSLRGRCQGGSSPSTASNNSFLS